MPERTALLIHCSREEAGRIREQARLERRTMSDHVLNIVIRALEVEERFAAPDLQPELEGARRRIVGERPRTAILIRCSTSEAKRIRAAAKRKQITISGYIILGLRRSWQAHEAVTGASRFGKHQAL